MKRSVRSAGTARVVLTGGLGSFLGLVAGWGVGILLFAVHGGDEAVGKVMLLVLTGGGLAAAPRME